MPSKPKASKKTSAPAKAAKAASKTTKSASKAKPVAAAPAPTPAPEPVVVNTAETPVAPPALQDEFASILSKLQQVNAIMLFGSALTILSGLYIWHREIVVKN